MWRSVLLLACLAGRTAAETEQTKLGGPCAALKDLEDDYIKRAEPQVFNIVDPGTSIQCTWNPGEKRICQGVGGHCEHDEL